MFMRLPQVCELTGLSRSRIYEKMARGEFPRACKLGARASGWVRAEVERWAAARIAERDAEHPGQVAAQPGEQRTPAAPAAGRQTRKPR